MKNLLNDEIAKRIVQANTGANPEPVNDLLELPYNDPYDPAKSRAFRTARQDLKLVLLLNGELRVMHHDYYGIYRNSLYSADRPKLVELRPYWLGLWFEPSEEDLTVAKSSDNPSQAISEVVSEWLCFGIGMLSAKYKYNTWIDGAAGTKDNPNQVNARAYFNERLGGTTYTMPLIKHFADGAPRPEIPENCLSEDEYLNAKQYFESISEQIAAKGVDRPKNFMAFKTIEKKEKQGEKIK